MLSEKLPWPSIADAEPLADGLWAPSAAIRTARAPSVVAAVAGADGGGHAVVGVVERDGLRRVLDPRADLGGLREQDRLEPDLGDEDPRDGLRSSTPSLMLRKYQSSSLPPRLSTETIAPFWTNSRAAASSIAGSSPTAR